MKNIQVIDGALNSVHDIFSVTDEEFSLIFPDGQDIAFIDEVMATKTKDEIEIAFRVYGRGELPNVTPWVYTEYSSMAWNLKRPTTPPDAMTRRSILTARRSAHHTPLTHNFSSRLTTFLIDPIELEQHR